MGSRCERHESAEKALRDTERLKAALRDLRRSFGGEPPKSIQTAAQVIEATSKDEG